MRCASLTTVIALIPIQNFPIACVRQQRLQFQRLQWWFCLKALRFVAAATRFLIAGGRLVTISCRAGCAVCAGALLLLVPKVVLLLLLLFRCHLALRMLVLTLFRAIVWIDDRATRGTS